MSKRESKTDPPVPQIVGFRIDKLAERSSGYEGDEQEELSESSVPFLPPTKEPPKEARQANEGPHQGMTSPSAAFLADAVEASAPSTTPSLQNYLRGGGTVATEAPTISLADNLTKDAPADGTVSPGLLQPSASRTRTDMNNSAFASTLSCALDNKERGRPSTDAVSRRSLESVATNGAALAGLEGAASMRQTPGNSGPLVERLLSDVPGALGPAAAAAAAAAAAGSSESGALRTFPASTGPSRATSVTSMEHTASNVALGTAITAVGGGGALGAKKAKGGGLSKVERRAKQEEQRARKAALQAEAKGTKAIKARDESDKEPRRADSRGQEAGKSRGADTTAGRQKWVPSAGPSSLDMFSHLPTFRNRSMQDMLATKQKHKLHPAVVALGFSCANGTITGSTHRTVAMLYVLQRVIADFHTPDKQAFSRSLSAHINACVGFLWDECQPACVPQRNSVKWLKGLISAKRVQINPQEREEQARQALMKDIDDFINERFVMAQRVICKEGCKKLWHGDVVMTYGASQVVMRILLEAYEQGTRFEVVCVDSRPSNAAEAFCKCLLEAGIPCSYLALNAVSHAMPSVTKVLLGASAVKSNGAVIARAGSAMVAMAAARAHKAVLVCAQSIKFHDDVQLDSITENERGSVQGMLHVKDQPELSKQLVESEQKGTISVLNLLYDAMPIEFITLIVTEFGLIPPTSVPVILREKQDDEAVVAGT